MKIEFSKRVQGNKDLGSFVTENPWEFFSDLARTREEYLFITLKYDRDRITNYIAQQLGEKLESHGMNFVRTRDGLWISTPEPFSVDMSVLCGDNVCGGSINKIGEGEKIGEETYKPTIFKHKYSLFREIPAITIYGHINLNREGTNPINVLEALNSWGAETNIVPLDVETIKDKKLYKPAEAEAPTSQGKEKSLSDHVLDILDKIVD